MNDSWFVSLSDQHKQFIDGRCSAVENVERYVKRIAKYDSAIGSYLRVDEEGSMRQALELDSARKAGKPLGPLAGTTVALKDLLVTRGVETTAASQILRGWVPPYDATVVTRLRDAGAIILGKTNMDEFAMGSSNENSAAGPTRNPWDKTRVPGGSSGGSAAAVAADFCSAALGTDTGGSIRQPAAFCGVVGLKPTYGRVSRYGIIAYASSLDQVGPITRTVRDCALVMNAIAGPDPQDATCAQKKVPDYTEALKQDVRGLRIGVADELDSNDANPDVRSRVKEALATLVDLGARTVNVKLPHTRFSLPAYYLIAPAEASSNLARYDGVRFGERSDDDNLTNMYGRTRASGFGPEVIRRIMLGTYALRAGYRDQYYKKAQQVRSLIAQDFARAFADVDVIASPTAPTTAFPIGSKTDPLDMYMSDIFTLSCNLAGLPGMSIPCGLDSDGLPVGLQLLGRPWEEHTLVGAASAYESVAPWTHPRVTA